MSRRLAAAALVLLLQAACARQAQPVRVLAAASLSDLLSATISNEAVLQFGASSQLASLIEMGAPADIVITADAESMDRLERKGLIRKDTRRILYRNRLVLVTPKDDVRIRSTSDLRHARRIGIGQPDLVPAGRYARQALRHVGLWDAVQPRLVFGQDVRVVLGWTSRGLIDAGVVYATDAQAGGATVRVAATFPEDSHAPIVYPAAIATSARNPGQAMTILARLGRPEALAVARRQGFQTR